MWFYLLLETVVDCCHYIVLLFLLLLLLLFYYYCLGNVSRDSTLLSFSMLAKFGLGSTFANLYVYGGELAPTSVRNMTIGILSIGARVGGVVLPFVMMLVRI